MRTFIFDYTMHGISLCIFPGTIVSAFGLHYRFRRLPFMVFIRKPYGFHIKNVRFPYQERTVSISRTYGFHMKTIKVCRLKQRYGLHAKPNVPYRYAIKCKDDVRTVSMEMAWYEEQANPAPTWQLGKMRIFVYFNLCNRW